MITVMTAALRKDAELLEQLSSSFYPPLLEVCYGVSKCSPWKN